MSTQNLPKTQLLLSKLNGTPVKVKAFNIDVRDHVSIMPVFIQSSTSDVNTLGTSVEQTNPGGFRKIEPKPTGVGETTTDGQELEKKDDTKRKRKAETSFRLLESKPTRRGVRTCVTCKGKIGYRSKMCKHCLKQPPVANELSSKEMLHNTLSHRKENEKTDVVSLAQRNDGKENDEKEYEQRESEQRESEQKESEQKENVNYSTLSADHNYVQIDYPQDQNIAVSPSQMFCVTETIPSDDRKLANEPKMMEEKNDVQHRVEVHQEASQEEGNTINMKGEHTDKGNIYGDMCIVLKQEKNRDVLPGRSPSHTSTMHDTSKLTECATFEENSISDSFMTATQANEKAQAGCLMQSGSKRKQAHPCKKMKKRKGCSGIQFMRIEPKPYLEDESKCLPFITEAPTTTRRKPSGTADSFRFLPSNPTRRGIMLCPMCQKEVGCRSKTCKHCKVVINYNKSEALANNNLLVVQMSPKTSPECTVFSVKKSITPSEERCFIRQATVKGCKEKTNGTSEFAWSCECMESEGYSEIPICGHSRCFFRNPKIIQARTAKLTVQKIDCLPIDNSFKSKLKQLWEKNKVRRLPLVQQVTLNTLVVLDIEQDTPECSTNPVTCVHIRFEKIKRCSLVQPHIFCSGKSCSYWSSLESQEEPPVTCLHYCISLWAIASDNELPEYFKMFLEASQVYLHSEVFESIVSS